MALFRALESGRPPDVRLFNDPYARGFLGPTLRVALATSKTPFVGCAVPLAIDRLWPGARTSGVARTRLIDAMLMAAVDNGVEQLVLLGSGFDCRPYRLPIPERISVVEVDHPSTLVVKQERLRSLLALAPARVQFVAIDFNSERLEESLPGVLERTARTLFIWEGVTNYLTSAAVDETFRSLRTLTDRCAVVFTYIDRAILSPATQRKGQMSVKRRLRSVGEEWTFGFDPRELPGYLSDKGFQLVEDLDAPAYRERYWGAKGRLMRGYEFYHVARAEAS
jgi:methyltransferase (TIGR00027 family)